MTPTHLGRATKGVFMRAIFTGPSGPSRPVVHSRSVVAGPTVQHPPSRNDTNPITGARRL